MRVIVYFLMSLVLRILATPFVLLFYLAGAFSRNANGWIIAIIAILEEIKSPEE